MDSTWPCWLFLDYQATLDPAIRERIILAHLGLADRRAARFRGSHGVAGEDLVQAARVGLVAAVDCYAIACIKGELRRCLRDTSGHARHTHPQGAGPAGGQGARHPDGRAGEPFSR